MNYWLIVLFSSGMFMSINLYGQSEEKESSQSGKIIERLEETISLTMSQKALIEQKVQQLNIEQLADELRKAVKETNAFIQDDVLTESQIKELKENSIASRMIKGMEKSIELTSEQEEAIEEMVREKGDAISEQDDPVLQKQIISDLRKEISTSILTDDQRKQLKSARGK